MNEFTLLPEKIQELKAAHKSIKNKNLAYKVNAILLRGTGWPAEEVAEALLLDDQTIRNYIHVYESSGIDGLLETNHKGRPPTLSEEEESELCEILDAEIYLTTASICQLVVEKYNVTYSISGMTDMLRRLGYVYKKPKLVPGNPDEEQQAVFIAQFNEFMEEKESDEAVIFMDAVHPIHNAIAGCGWIRKGEDKELKTNTGRQRLNIHGGINAETQEIITLSSESNVNAEATIQFLEYVESIYITASIIYCICDNAKYHFCKKVEAYLKTSRIKLIPLPAYSPELNLIERIWGLFKKKTLYNKYYATYAEFKKACEDFFINQKNYESDISSILGNGLEAFS